MPRMPDIVVTLNDRRHSLATMRLASGPLLSGRKIRRRRRLCAHQDRRLRRCFSHRPSLHLLTSPRSVSVTSTTTPTASNAVHPDVHLDRSGQILASGEVGSQLRQNSVKAGAIA